MNKVRAISAVLAITCLTAPAIAEDPNLARNLAATCANCHGTNGLTVDGDGFGEMVSLAGMAAEEILEKVSNYRSDDMPATIMHQIARGYTEEQLKLIADFFAAQGE